MKRNENLQPLSRQHHNGLLAVLLLEKGIAKKAAPEVMAAFITHLWENDLALHFRLEEEYLLPLMEPYPLLKNHADRILKEHALLKQLILSIQAAPNAASIAEFAALLEQHIRFEERIAFTETEQLLPAATLQQLGAVLQEQDDKNCMDYPVKFWE